MTQQDPERRTARTQRDSGGAAEAQKSGRPTERKTAAAPRESAKGRDDESTARSEQDKAQPLPSQAGRGHKAQLAAPHRSGRPSGGNIRQDRDG